ncbi:hypothetical protein [Chryseobacterium indoltheticum]|uniref:hypothetical protein n=1 Tax=Chryseobacterium indoltheticum TaxID=254 RepID=UPI003F4956ED
MINLNISMEIKNIVFDFGGVLMDWNPRYFFKTYFNDDEKMEYFLENIAQDEWNIEQDRGRTLAEGTEVQIKNFRNGKRNSKPIMITGR